MAEVIIPPPSPCDFEPMPRRSLFVRVRAFFAPVAGAVRKELNAEEKRKTVAAAAAAWATAQSAEAAHAATYGNTDLWMILIPLCFALVVALAEGGRRFWQGEEIGTFPLPQDVHDLEPTRDVTPPPPGA